MEGSLFASGLVSEGRKGSQAIPSSFTRYILETSAYKVEEAGVVGLDGLGEVPGAGASLLPLTVGDAPRTVLGIWNT